MIDAIVVVLPEPVAPQIRTSPRDSRASTSIGIGNRSDASVGTSRRQRADRGGGPFALAVKIHPEPVARIDPQ